MNLTHARNSSPHIPKTLSADVSVGPAKPTGEVHSLHRIRERTVPATALARHGLSGTPLPDTLAVITKRTFSIVNTYPFGTHFPVLVDPPIGSPHISSSTARGEKFDVVTVYRFVLYLNNLEVRVYASRFSPVKVEQNVLDFLVYNNV